MNLKKAFQFQAALKKLESEVIGSLLDRRVYLKVTKTSKKSVLNGMNEKYTFVDEVKDLSDSQYGKFQIDKAIKALELVTKWRSQLAQGIAKAKTTVSLANGMDYDGALIYAKDQRNCLESFRALAYPDKVEDYYDAPLIGEKETQEYLTVPTEMGSANLSYTVVTTTTEDEAAQAMAREKLRELTKAVDELSDSIEEAAITTHLDKKFEPPIPINLTAEELYNDLECYL